jgi:AcrR family transcriptional regulator
MIDKTIDIRISRTHKLIKEAFFELMNQIGFDKITVQNLTKQAMISRTTFYLHYKDKYDLLDKIEDEILSGFQDLSNNPPVNEIIASGLSHEKPFALLVKVYEYIQENQQFFKLIMGPNGNPSFYYKLNETMKLTFRKNIIIDRLKIPEPYAIAFIIGFQTNLINEWITSGMKETPYEIALMITRVFGDVPKNLYK